MSSQIDEIKRWRLRQQKNLKRQLDHNRKSSQLELTFEKERIAKNLFTREIEEMHNLAEEAQRESAYFQEGGYGVTENDVQGPPAMRQFF